MTLPTGNKYLPTKEKEKEICLESVTVDPQLSTIIIEKPKSTSSKEFWAMLSFLIAFILFMALIYVFILNINSCQRLVKKMFDAEEISDPHVYLQLNHTSIDEHKSSTDMTAEKNNTISRVNGSKVISVTQNDTKKNFPGLNFDGFEKSHFVGKAAGENHKTSAIGNHHVSGNKEVNNLDFQEVNFGGLEGNHLVDKTAEKSYEISAFGDHYISGNKEDVQMEFQETYSGDSEEERNLAVKTADENAKFRVIFVHYIADNMKNAKMGFPQINSDNIKETNFLADKRADRNLKFSIIDDQNDKKLGSPQMSFGRDEKKQKLVWKAPEKNAELSFTGNQEVIANEYEGKIHFLRNVKGARSY